MNEVVYTTGSWVSRDCEDGYCFECDDPQCMCPHHHRGDTMSRHPQLTRKERAINNMQCRMPWSEAELYATELDLRGFLESGDRPAAVELLAAHMPERRATAIVNDLIRSRIMWHPDYA